MKLDLAKTLGIVTNVGVIAGIVFLGFELNQNQMLGRAQARNDIARTDHELTMFGYENNFLEYQRRMADGDTSVEVQDAIETWTSLWMRHYQNLHYQYRLGLFDEDEFEPFMTELMQIVNTQSGQRRLFCRGRHIMSPAFVALVESRLSTACE